MTCPKCGYALDPFETACPKCAREAAERPVATLPDPRLPKVQPAADDRPPIHYVPDRGWPLTIVLWMLLVTSVLNLAFVGLAAYNADYDILHTGVTVNVGPVGLLSCFTPLLTVIAVLGLLRGSRWGFGLFMITAISLAYRLLFKTPSVVDAVTALLGALMVVLVLGRWNEFE